MQIKKILCGALPLLLGIVAIQFFQIIPSKIVASEESPALERTLIPRSLLFGNPVKAAPRLSSQGKKLAYLAPDENNVLNVWVKDLQNMSPDKKITSDTKRGIRSYMWQYDEENLLYVQDRDGDENWHLYQTNLETGQTKNLTPFEGVRVGILAYSHEYPNEMLLTMNKSDPQLSDVYRLNLLTGEILLDTKNMGEVIEWVADHQLNIRANSKMIEDGSSVISVRESVDAPWKDLLKIDASELDKGILGFTENGKSLYCFTSIDANTVRLIELNTESGKYSVIAENPVYDLSNVQMNPITHRLEAVSYEGERHVFQPLDPEIAADFEWLKVQNLTPNAQNEIHLASRDIANQQWIISVVSDVRSTSYYLFHRKDKTLTFLFNTKPDLDAQTLNPMKPISFIARDGMELYGYLTLPVHKDSKHLPLVLHVHGGPWARNSWGYHPEAQWLADRGYAVLQINFRGSTGYGKTYLNAGNREWGGKMHLDLLDAKQWAINSGVADPNKVAIYGGSYGGYATLAALAFTPEEFCCGVDVVGPSNLITLMQTLPPYWVPLKAQMDLRIGCLETEPEFLRECSPLFKCHQITKPLLIAQGANDPRVKQAESDQIVAAMRNNKLPVQYLLFKDEGHGFARPENRMKFYAAAEAFLATYLGGEAEDPRADEEWTSVEG